MEPAVVRERRHHERSRPAGRPALPLGVTHERAERASQHVLVDEVRRREHYEKPSVRRKKKLVAARKRRSRAG